MATQLNFQKNNLKQKNDNGKRIRYAIPTYRKCYAVYAYDREKYMNIFRKLRKLAIKYNDKEIYFKADIYKILNHCYFRTKNGNKKYLGDERHIFRYKTLHKIQQELAQYVEIPIRESIESAYDNGSGLLLWQTVYNNKVTLEAEIKGVSQIFCNLSSSFGLKQQVLIHLHLLRLLRKRCNVKTAVQEAWKYIGYGYNAKNNARF